MKIIDDIGNIGVADAFAIWREINQTKIDRANSESQNTINELNASATLQRLNNDAVRNNGSNVGFNPFASMDKDKMLGYAFIGVAALGAVYLLVKK